MLASTRRDRRVGAVANVNEDVVLVIAGTRPRWSYWSAWTAWWVRCGYPTANHSVIGAWDVTRVDLPRERRYPTWHVVTIGGQLEVGSEKLRYFDDFSELPAWSVYHFHNGFGVCRVCLFYGGQMLFQSKQKSFQHIWDNGYLIWYWLF